MLLENKANGNRKGQNELALVFQRAENDYADVCAMSLENNVNVNKKGENETKALLMAAQNGHSNVCLIRKQHKCQSKTKR